MDARSIIYNRFLKPFENKKIGAVGCELEFPLINLSGGDVDADICRGFLKNLEKKGFTAELCSPDGTPLFMKNADGDCLSFDNSFNNFEFSMFYSDNILDIKSRFDSLFEMASEAFSEYSYSFVGKGTNPQKNTITSNAVSFPTYEMIKSFLFKFPGKHGMTDFPAYLSSVQTHLDVSLDELPFMYTLFSRLDFARAILFANSPDFDGKGYRIYRDYLWEKSGFGTAHNITGKVDEGFETVSDILDFFEKKDIFNRIRNGKYEVFSPVNICEYFENPAYGALPGDIEQYLSFKNVEITARGTLEIRGDCQQPTGEGFVPVAFNTGILNNAEKADSRISKLFEKEKISLTNSELRNIVAEGRDITKVIRKEELIRFLKDLVSIAEEGLILRGKGEEDLLAPLYEKTEKRL